MKMAFTLVKAWLSDLTVNTLKHDALSLTVKELGNTYDVLLKTDEATYYVQGDIMGVTVAHNKIAELLSAGSCDFNIPCINVATVPIKSEVQDDDYPDDGALNVSPREPTGEDLDDDDDDFAPIGAPRRKFNCNQCDFSAKSIQKLRCHTKRRHSTPHLGCPFCSRKFSIQKDLRKHVRKNHADKDQKTPAVRLSVSGQARKPKIFGCPLCVKSYTTQSALAVHTRNIHKKELDELASVLPVEAMESSNSVKPEVGGKTDLTVDAVQSEIMNFLPSGNDVACDFCELRFSTIPDLRRHREQDHLMQYESQRADIVFTPGDNRRGRARYPGAAKTRQRPVAMDADLGGLSDSDEENSSRVKNMDLMGKVANYDKIHEDATKVVDDAVEALKAKLGTAHLKAYPCKVCSFVAERREQLRQHYLRKHLPKSIYCKHPGCGREYGIYRDWKRHHYNHTMEGRMTCKHADCNKTFTDYKAFERHQLTHQPGYVKQLWSCEDCGRTFTSKAGLKFHHERFHEGMEKKWLCVHCGSRFSQKNALKEHMNIHTGERPFQCDMCDKAFGHESSLRSHKRSHSDRTYYTCEFCGKDFKFLNSYRSHQRLHTGERKYECDLCTKTFAQPHQLVRHRRIHTGDKPYQCTLCNSKFNDSSILRRHMHGVHSLKSWKTSDGHFIFTGERKRETRWRELNGLAGLDDSGENSTTAAQKPPAPPPSDTSIPPTELMTSAPPPLPADKQPNLMLSNFLSAANFSDQFATTPAAGLAPPPPVTPSSTSSTAMDASVSAAVNAATNAAAMGLPPNAAAGMNAAAAAAAAAAGFPLPFQLPHLM